MLLSLIFFPSASRLGVFRFWTYDRHTNPLINHFNGLERKYGSRLKQTDEDFNF